MLGVFSINLLDANYPTPTMFCMICCYPFMCMYEKIEWVAVS